MKRTFNQSRLLKLCFALSLVLISIIISDHVLAQEEAEETASSTPSASSIDEEKVKALKDKLATKVAELRQSKTRGFYGEIAALSKTSFTLITANGEIKIRYDENIQIIKLDTKRAVAAAKDLKNTLTASVLGLYDEESKQLTANVILLQTLPKYVFGELTKVDKTAAELTLKTSVPTKTVDYERTTKASELTADQKISKSGLSRLTTNDWLYVWGTQSEDDATKLKALRILRVPLSLFAKVEASPSPEVKSESSPSPKSTPKATPKTSPKASPSPEE